MFCQIDEQASAEVRDFVESNDYGRFINLVCAHRLRYYVQTN